ncbi:helix-turn-helix domain-containing protein [Advenella faeciporci]
MEKYDVQFKVKLVKEYLFGDSGYRLIADTYGVDISQLRYWVASYQHHGVSGLENKCATYSTEFKQQVLQRIDREGLSDRQAAAMYNIRSIGTIGQWRRQYNTGESGAWKSPHKGETQMQMPKKHLPKAPAPDQTPTQKEVQAELSDLQAENAYLRAENAYLKKLRALIEAKQTAALQKKRKSSRD